MPGLNPAAPSRWVPRPDSGQPEGTALPGLTSRTRRGGTFSATAYALIKTPHSLGSRLPESEFGAHCPDRSLILRIPHSCASGPRGSLPAGKGRQTSPDAPTRQVSVVGRTHDHCDVEGLFAVPDVSLSA